MNRQDTRALLTFARTIPEVSTFDLLESMKMARRVHSLATKWCDYGLNKRDEKEWARLESKLSAIFSPHGYTVELNGDPRGGAVKLFRSDLKGNTWGGDEAGYSIPF